MVFTFGDLKQRLGHRAALVHIVDCVSARPSPFAVKFGIVLENPRVTKPFPVEGQSGFLPRPVQPKRECR